MKPYQIYKSVDLKWLNQIPDHWNLERAKTMFARVNRLVEESDGTITCFRDGVVTLRKNRRTTGFTESLKEIGYQGIRKGDLVIHQMDAFAGAVGVSDSDGKGTPVYSVCVPKSHEYNNYYYAHLVREMGKNGFIQSLYRGIRERSSDFRFETFAKLKLPIPPRIEQDQIVKFLDFRISKINKFIKEKKREIELLKELKQAEINRAVTKGLNPNVPMKNSGIDWLGETPEHWEIKRIKNVLVEMEERSINGNEEPLSMSQKRGIVKSSDLSIPNMASSYVGGKIARKNDLVFNKLKAHLGVFSVSKYEGVVSPDYAVYSSLNQDNVEYIERLFKTNIYIQQFIKHSRGIAAGLRRLYTNDLFSIKICLPKSSEQDQIVDYIINFEVKTNKVISAIESEISLVQEYKTKLISEAVTGKVDVREVKIDEVFELETLDETEIEEEVAEE